VKILFLMVGLITPMSVCAFSQEIGTGTFLCDAALGIFASQRGYKSWWRYFLHPQSLLGPYSHSEPPPIEHTIFDWPKYIPAWPLGALPNDINPHITNFIHPEP